MNENGLAATQPTHIGPDRGSYHWVPRLVHPIGTSSVPRSHPRPDSVFDLHGSTPGKLVPGNQRKHQRTREVINMLLDIFVACGSLYMIVFVIMLVL